MNIRPKRLNWMIAACVAPVIYGLGGFVSQIEAQTVPSQVASRSTLSEASTPQGADLQDAELQQRVSEALHAQPYLDDRHIDVSVRGGAVVLGGIVFSDWDLRDALRTARKAAGARLVIDSLSIEEGGR
jgi:osmotically-inducible protein OsmY